MDREFLNDDEILKLEDGLIKDSDLVAFSEAKKILGRLGFEYKPRAQRARGRKRVTNKTEDEPRLR